MNEPAALDRARGRRRRHTQRSSLWVDTYASEFSRDIEPTVEGGDTVYNVAASCVLLYKAGLTCATAPAGAPCCNSTATAIYVNVWSLSRVDGSDNLLTTSANEVAVLVASGQWKQNCHVVPGPSVFCVDTSLADGRAGPFLLYNTTAARTDGSLAPLYRCITAAGLHYASPDADCEGAGTQEYMLGYASTTRGNEFVRGFSRCATGGSGGAARLHALDLPCDTPAPGPSGSAVFGYVK